MPDPDYNGLGIFDFEACTVLGVARIITCPHHNTCPHHHHVCADHHHHHNACGDHHDNARMLSAFSVV
jgi:hypothetical protein